jgi:hypothetical protein
MPLIEGRNLHIDAVLSNIMVGRRTVGGIVNDLVPVMNVSKQSDVYYKSNYKENLLYDAGLTDRAKGAKSREVYFSVSSDTYYARNYALGTRWFDEDAVNADDPIRLRQRSAALVTDRLNIDYEARIAALAGNASNVSTTISVATPWSNTTGSRPFDDLSDAVEGFRELSTLRPNVLILPEQVAVKVRKSDQVRDLLFGDRGGVASDQQIANLLKVDRILVPEINYNTAGVGATAAGSGTVAPVWGNRVYLAYVANLQSQDPQDTWFQAFRWTDPSFGVPFAIRAFPHDDERRSQKIEASYYQTEKVISTDLGMAINSVI